MDQPSLRAFVQQAAEFSASQVSDADDAYTFFDQTFRSFGDWRHGSVYLFVIKPDGFNVFHASRKEFEGTHQLQVEDKNGTKVVQELIRAARGGGGFVEYFFDNPGIIGDEESGSLKVGYAARVSIGEGFILVAGYYPANSQERVEAQEEANRNFLGLRFGVALGMTATISGDDRVEEAELVENIVRVKSTTNHRPRVLLETHYFWQWKADDATVNVAGRPVTIRQADIGVGPFVAIQTSGEDILEAFGMGVMWGFRREGSSSFNIGAGFLLDPKVKMLGSDVVPNEPLPQGESEVRLEEKPRWGFLTLVSFSF